MVKHEILIESNELSEQFSEVITLINKARTNVIKVANTAMIDLYWQVGKLLHEKLANAEWGDSVVAQLADFIAKNAPDIKGFSDKNLWRMKQFFETYPNTSEILSPLVRQISWTNNLLIMSRVKTAEGREFYWRLCILRLFITYISNTTEHIKSYHVEQ